MLSLSSLITVSSAPELRRVTAANTNANRRAPRIA